MGLGVTASSGRHCPAGPCANAAPLWGPFRHKAPEAASSTTASACCSTAADNRCRPASAPSGRYPALSWSGEPLRKPVASGAITAPRLPQAQPRRSAKRPARVARPAVAGQPCHGDQALPMAQVSWPMILTMPFSAAPSLMARLRWGGCAPRASRQPPPGFRREDRGASTSRSWSCPSGTVGGGMPRSQAAAREHAVAGGQRPHGWAHRQWQDRAFPAGRPQPPGSRAAASGGRALKLGAHSRAPPQQFPGPPAAAARGRGQGR